ncbi:MAG: hypothetical protein M1826_005834 [Phylliscum demangeonii]|nr:MAG: hypothetical protein M1826_005834 [Phylliscum demangeonii]
MGLGPSKTGAFTALVPCLPMFFSTWETYHTHTLYLGYFNGPTEGLIIACLMMISSGYYGPSIWTTPLSDVTGHPEIFGARTARDLFIPIVLGSFLFAHLPFCIANVVRARRQARLPIAPVFLEWTPMLLYSGGIAAWLFSPHSSLLPHNHLALFCFTMSFVFGRMTTKIILAHLTHQPFPRWTAMLAPLLAGAVLANLPILTAGRYGPVPAHAELWYLRAYFVFAAVAYFRWALLVIDAICTYLGIRCLTIPTAASTAKTAARQIGAEGAKMVPGVLEGRKKAADGGGHVEVKRGKTEYGLRHTEAKIE